jgi:predicted ester cyclase
MPRDAVLELLRREVTPESYAEIRTLWKQHSMAEDRRDLPGLIATLTDDCVYELVNTGAVWCGHDGARQFYTELLGAFPDIHFDLTHIVIGPQGVCEEAEVSGTHQADWQGLHATGEGVRLSVIIFFPWDPNARKFRGERIFVQEEQ